jgi:hypothetical protein
MGVGGSCMLFMSAPMRLGRDPRSQVFGALDTVSSRAPGERGSLALAP